MRCARELLHIGCMALVTLSVFAAPPAAAPLPANSIYRIPPLTLRDQRGEVFSFASLRGQSRLVGMFYGSCKMACPLEIEALKQIEHALANKTVPVVLVSFDPAHDDIAMLRKVAAEHGVAAPLFRLSRPEQGDEGMLAGVLGIAYRSLPGGGFEHNVVVALLDQDGRIAATTNASGTTDPAFVKAIISLQAHR